MSEAEKAAMEFVRSEEFKVQYTPRHADSFLAGAAWATERDARVAEARVRCQSNYDMCREAEIIAAAIRAQTGGGK